MFKLNMKFDADSLLYLLSHFECNSHTVHMLTPWHPPPPLTGIMKSSLFMHAPSSPLSLAARLYQCHMNHSHSINYGWNFSRQSSCTCPYLYTCVCICDRCILPWNEVKISIMVKIMMVRVRRQMIATDTH